MSEVSLLIAFGAGVLGFLSPCIVPLIPGYLSFVSGVSLQEMGAARREHMVHTLLATAIFVLGFATVFTTLGATASLVGNFVLSNRQLLTRIAGVVVLIMGLAILRVLKLPGFYRERRLQFSRNPQGTTLGAFPVGMAFGFAWTPCVGPALTAILSLAATAELVSDGAMLLFVYSLGLGLPFLIAAALLTTAFDALRWVARHGRILEAVSGTFLVVMGVALIFDMVFRLNGWLLRVIPFRPGV